MTRNVATFVFYHAAVTPGTLIGTGRDSIRKDTTSEKERHA